MSDKLTISDFLGGPVVKNSMLPMLGGGGAQSVQGDKGSIPGQGRSCMPCVMAKKKKKDPALEPEEQKVVPGDATMAVGTSWTVAEGPRVKWGNKAGGTSMDHRKHCHC